MALTLRTQLPVEEAARRVTDAIVNGSFSAELVAQSDSRGPDGAQCVTLLFDKYFLRAGNHCALCVNLDNLSGITKVFAAAPEPRPACSTCSTGARATTLRRRSARRSRDESVKFP